MNLSPVSLLAAARGGQQKTDTEPADLVREAYARFARGDLDGIVALLSPEIEITQAPAVPWGGRFTGRAGAQEYLARLARYADAAPDPIIYVPAGGDVAVVGRLRGRVRSNGRALDLVVVHLWTVCAGQVVRFAAYADTPAVREALDLH